MDKYSDDDNEREIGSTVAGDAKILANTLVLLEVEPPLMVVVAVETVVAAVAFAKPVAVFVPDHLTFSGSSAV